ncbi:MAG: lysophospholipid acyltransferase family protein [Bacteroidota bacterium]
MLILRLLSRLPMGGLYFLADFIFVLAYYLIGYRKKVVKKNISNAFPEKTVPEQAKICREFYRRFSEYLVETLKAISISKEELLKRVKYINVPQVQPYADAGQSIIVIASHQFNWEWALLAGCLELPFPVDAVYQKLRNENYDLLMLETRGKFGGQPIEKSKVLRAILKSKDRLRALGIVADQSPRRSSPKYWTTFLNQETAFFLGAEQIARAVNYPAYFFAVRRLRRGYYTVKLEPLTKPPYPKDDHSLLERYANATEDLVASDPAGYLWSHKRWKLRREENED